MTPYPPNDFELAQGHKYEAPSEDRIPYSVTKDLLA